MTHRNPTSSVPPRPVLAADGARTRAPRRRTPLLVLGLVLLGLGGLAATHLAVEVAEVLVLALGTVPTGAPTFADLLSPGVDGPAAVLLVTAGSVAAALGLVPRRLRP